MPQLRWATIRAVGARTAGGGQTDETTATPYVRSHGEQTTRNTTVSPIHHSQSDLRGETKKAKLRGETKKARK